jgi:preprotein translocase subunit SecG
MMSPLSPMELVICLVPVVFVIAIVVIVILVIRAKSKRTDNSNSQTVDQSNFQANGDHGDESSSSTPEKKT